MARTLVACSLILALHASVARAVPKEALEGAQQAVSTKLDGLVRSTLDQFFKEVGQDPPEHVDVGTAVDFDATKAEPVINQVKLAVTLTSDLPPEVIRQARQELVRAMKANGYRTDLTEAGDTPVINFNIESLPIDHSKEHTSIKEIMIFGALVAGAVFFTILAIQIILWGVRPISRGPRKKRPKSSRTRQGEAPMAVAAAAANGLPTIPVNYWAQEPTQDLPPLPQHGIIPGPERH